MDLSQIVLTKKDFIESNWQDVINKSKAKGINQYATLFGAKAEEFKLNDLKKCAVFTLLAVVSLPPLKFDEKPDPSDYFDRITEEAIDYHDYFDNNKEAVELIDNHLNALKDWVSEISDAELRARVAELVEDFDEEPSIIPFYMRKLAIDSYIESAKNLESSAQWNLWFTNIRRTVELAFDIKYRFNNVVAYAEEVLNKYQGEDSFLLSDKLEELLEHCKKEIC